MTPKTQHHHLDDNDLEGIREQLTTTLNEKHYSPDIAQSQDG